MIVFHSTLLVSLDKFRRDVEGCCCYSVDLNILLYSFCGFRRNKELLDSLSQRYEKTYILL